MHESFGARLRQRREQQGITLVTIAQQTKIKASLLEALERDDVSHWPSGIFRRAFIRAYAHAIGLDPDTVVREFLAAHPDPVEIVETLATSGPASTGAPPGGAPARLRSIVGSAIGSLARFRRAPASEPSATPSEPTVTESSVADPVAPLEAAAPEATSPVTASPEAAPLASSLAESELLALAHLCTDLGRVENANEMPPLLEEASRLMGARGVIVWMWDERAGALRPALVHGYSDKVLAQLPSVRRDAENATAAAFRTTQTRVIHGNDDASGALVVPLLTPGACVGVLAIELPHGAERSTPVRAVAMILAAQLAQLIGAQTMTDCEPNEVAWT